MELELTPQQVEGLCAIDAKGFVQSVQQDILRECPGLALSRLTERLTAALAQARALGIDDDANLVDFLRTEAMVPGFYTQPGLRFWMERPGRPADQRFHDFMQVMRWHMRHSADQQKTE